MNDCGPGRHGQLDAHRAVLLREEVEADKCTLSALRADPFVEVLDHSRAQILQFEQLFPRDSGASTSITEAVRWAYYPWRRMVVSVLGPADFSRLRLDRNRNKITSAEQSRFRKLRIGVVGLSVGHAIAHTLALEGLCGQLKLVDFDAIELSNLNRIPATILDIGTNKAIVAARRIAEVDPYLQVEVEPGGLSEANIESFLNGLDLVVEECDSLDIKVLVRQKARERGIPVLMETSDRGLLDVERFDLDRHRPLFHGLLGDIDPTSFPGLSMTEKAPHVLRILEADALSGRMAASMAEIDRTVSSWPQLAGDVQLGGATIASAVRRFGLGESLPSGRIRIDLTEQLDGLNSLIEPDSARLGESGHADDDTGADDPGNVVDATVEAIRRAPSGGNAQPWQIEVSPSGVDILLDIRRSVCMDVSSRGSYVAIGAAEFNARVAAAAFSRLGESHYFPRGQDGGLAVRIEFGTSGRPDLADLYPGMLHRMSNRSPGRRGQIDARTAARLTTAAAAEGGKLRLITDDDPIRRLAKVLALSDRIRFLTPTLHSEMFGELRWPGDPDTADGIEVRTMGLSDAEIAKLRVARRGVVMHHLARWGGGQSLGDNTYDRVVGASAIAVITVVGDAAEDYLRGGAAVERFWVEANLAGLGVYPTSPVFLYARHPAELESLAPEFTPEVAALQRQLGSIIGLDDETLVLILRLVHDPARVPRSRRRPVAELLRRAGEFAD